MFEPIAIIGTGCILPGALTPKQLWENRLANVCSLKSATLSNWNIEPSVLISEKTLPHDIVGAIDSFDYLFDANSFFLPKDEIFKWDPFFYWLLQACQNAFHEANYSLDDLKMIKTGAVIGNLSYPSASFCHHAESVWLLNQDPATIGHRTYHQLLTDKPHPINRFMSGLPLHHLSQALHLSVDSFAVDAACASSLYAIKLACDKLHSRSADLMFAGGVNGTNLLYTHIGFHALKALGPSGKSRPFHKEADGLIPAQGSAIILLKRLSDAINSDDEILGVIRGIGLSNDGNSGSFLTPAIGGQIMAMKRAYAQSGIQKEEVSWIECHATGTHLGDSIELSSMQSFFESKQKISIGALKANIGHTITASATSALINVLSAFKAKIKPPTIHEPESICKALDNSSFYLLNHAEEWQSKTPRKAAINAFGFGGNNAHLIVEEWQKNSTYKNSVQKPKSIDTIAIVGVGLLAGSAENSEEFLQILKSDQPKFSEYEEGYYGSYLDSVDLPIQNIPFPPSDLKSTSGQQLAMLKASLDALKNVNAIDPEKTSVLVGIGCDIESARFVLRTTLSHVLPEKDPSWILKAKDAIALALTPANIGSNIAANRLNVLYNFTNQGYSVSSEEHSGITSLEIAIQGLLNHEYDAALVGACDMCCESAHIAAVKELLPQSCHIPGDAAVCLVLKRLSDATRDDDTIFATLPQVSSERTPDFELNNYSSKVLSHFGHTHAASGLLHVATAALLCYNENTSSIKVEIEALGAKKKSIEVLKGSL
ncbi:MAG: beta-ketoacyl synthase N-terminal-like domain-containing protein [Chlamydiales bacterium]|nr:beta-ketoacyl synthase N-terminal-like domain-containing protein [Chlamydiales bacterium]